MTKAVRIALIISLILVGILLIIFWPIRGAMKVDINGTQISVMVADTEVAHKQGLSGYERIKDDQGMLFLFDQPYKYMFWMKDMKFPLDIIFIRDGRIVDMASDLPAPKEGESPATFTPNEMADRVLEVNAGTAKKFGWSLGTEVKF
ncbi:MAG: DUF192 domain-containing protein [Patescibacteria group bacterium]